MVSRFDSPENHFGPKHVLVDMARWLRKLALVLLTVGLTFLLGLILGLHIGRSERSVARSATLTPCERAVADAASSSKTGSITGLFRAVGACPSVAEWEIATARYPAAVAYRGSPGGSLAVLRYLCRSGNLGPEITTAALCEGARRQGL